MGRAVLVTGASRYLGARVAELLSRDPDVSRVVATDTAAPRRALGGAEFAPVRLHDGGIGALVQDTGADTVVHLGFADSAPLKGRGRRRSPAAVLGTLQLLDACQRSDDAARLVVRSSAAVYRGPAAEPFTEPGTALATGAAAVAGDTAAPHARDAADIERHTLTLARRRPDLSVAVLRFASVIGPSVETPLTRYLGLRLVPTVRGEDPRMQFLHPDDAADATCRTALAAPDGGSADGIFNVAAPGSVPLSRVLQRVAGRRFAVPERGLRVLGGITRRSRVDYSPDQLRLLCSGRVLDAGKLERSVGWRPAYTSAEALESYLTAS
ncbi:NAD-dependent epimerase/dehydratase family protein [Nocardiopsis coralliicola]